MNDQSTRAADDYALWRAMLAGEMDLDYERGKPYCGHWKIRDRQGRTVPVSVWRDPEGHIVGRVGLNGISMTVDDRWCDNVMSYALRSPISQDEFDHFKRHGRWSDDAPAPAVHTSNLPADEFEAWRVLVEAEWDSLTTALTKDTHLDDNGSSQYGNWRIRFDQLWMTGEAMRKAEKRPHDEAAAAVQDKYRGLLDKVESAKRLIAQTLTAFLEEKQARLDAEIGEASAYDLPDVAPKAHIRTGGKRMSLASTWHGEIWDYDIALEACKHHDEVKAAVQRIANQAARTKYKIPMPGVKFIETKKAR